MNLLFKPTKHCFSHKALFIVIIFSLLFISGGTRSFAQRVTPFQSGSYVPVLSSLRDFAPAPKGIYLLSYLYWVSPQSFYDRNGNKLSNVNIDLPVDVPGIGDNIADLYPKARAFMGNITLYYSSPEIKQLGNAKYSFILGPSFQMSRYEVNATIGEEEINKKGGISGYGDFFLQPLGLSWSFDNKIDVSFYYSLYLPTASYQTGADNNLGTGHITHQLQIPFLAYANNQATAFLIAPTLEFNGKLIDRDVKPGSRLSLEYGVSQYLSERFEIEVMNAHNWQIGNDKGEDAWWLNTPFQARDRQNLVSVGLNAWSWAERLQMRFKYVWTYGARQNVANNFFSASLFFDPHWLTKQKRVNAIID
ncbi:MAG: hypothetical protein BM564_11455 [Bacteroidetes bacterium MedPE-SWsnd-G2]|nr:MAG: hypothetical protein BM564_11455 [Bacteroidetes bacterium MedPE-SWsnd-G2]